MVSLVNYTRKKFIKLTQVFFKEGVISMRTGQTHLKAKGMEGSGL